MGLMGFRSIHVYMCRIIDATELTLTNTELPIVPIQQSTNTAESFQCSLEVSGTLMHFITVDNIKKLL